MKATVISKPVILDGQEYLLSGCLAFGGLRFWVERPRGTVCLRVNEPVQQVCSDLDPLSEILALTWDAPPLTRLVLSSGWFEFTNRTLAHPVSQVNEVWRLTPDCLSMLVQSGSDTDVDKKLARIESGPTMDLLLGETMNRMRASSVASMFVIRPDPAQGNGLVLRSLAAISSPLLKSRRELLESGPGRLEQAVFSVDLAARSCAWSAALADDGYRTAQVVRIPVAGEAACEFVALSLSPMMTELAAQTFAFDLLSRWPQWRQAIQASFCVLTQKERHALQSVSRGLTGAEAAQWLGISERTYRMHIDNAKKKLVAASAAEAAHNAQLLCAF